jgi:hypothetical protein
MSDHDDRDDALSRQDDAQGQFTAGDATQGSEHGETVDLTLLQADDALLDALGSADPDVSGPLGDDQLNSLLLSWRHEVDAQPMAELVDTETAVHVVAAARSSKLSKRKRFLVPMTSAAAVLVIAFSVVGMAARSAQPGDTLWGVTQVLYSTHAQSVETAASLRQQLDRTRSMINSGNTADAQAMLAKVSKSLNNVQGEDGKAQLVALHDQLLAQLNNPGQTTTTTPARKHATTSVPSQGQSQQRGPDTRSSTAPSPTVAPSPPETSTSPTSPSSPSSPTTPPPSSPSSPTSAPGTGHSSSTGGSPNISKDTASIPPSGN